MCLIGELHLKIIEPCSDTFSEHSVLIVLVRVVYGQVDLVVEYSVLIRPVCGVIVPHSGLGLEHLLDTTQECSEWVVWCDTNHDMTFLTFTHSI